MDPGTASANTTTAYIVFKDGMVRNSARVSKEKWTEHKELLCSLYQEKTIAEILVYMRTNHNFEVNAGQLGRKLREWNVYKYDSKHRPTDLDKPFSDDAIVGRTLSVASHEVSPEDPRSEYYLPTVPTTTPLSMEYNNSSLDPDFRNNPYNIASANHIAMSKEEQSSLDAKLLSISPRAFDQSVLADANGTYYTSTGPITVTEPSVILSPSGDIPSEYGRAMDTDIDRISITSLALSSISGFASLRSLARRIRMDRIVTEASSEDQSRNDVPSSAMQWDTSSKNSLRLFGRFSMSSLSVASSRRTDTSSSQMSWKPEAQSAVEGEGGYTAKYQREGTLPRFRSASQDTFSVRRGLDEEYYIPMIVRRVQDYEMRDLTRIGYGRLNPGMGVDIVWERFLEEPDYKYARKTNTGFIRLGGIRLQPVGKISMQWHEMGKDGQVYITDFVIIPKDIPVNSDFVLGTWDSKSALLTNSVARSNRFWPVR